MGAYCNTPTEEILSGVCYTPLSRDAAEIQEYLINVVAQFIEPYGLINQATTFSDNFAGMTGKRKMQSGKLIV